MRNISKVFNGFLSLLLTFVCCLFLSNLSHSQTLCTGKLGATTIFKGFGSGTPIYNTAPAATFGFSTTFTIWNRANTNDGFYSIVNRIPNDFGGIWHSGALDHTPDDVNGYMLLVNGDATLGEFYRDTAVGLCQGATYEFSSYLANVFRPAGGGVPTSNAPRVRFEIRDLTNTVLYSSNSGNVATSAAFTWTKFGITFNSPSSSVILVMVSTAPAGTGNDIVIDDIAFAPCMPGATITKKVSVCENNNTNLTVDVTGNADYRFSQWQKSRDKGLTWIDTGAVITQTSGLSAYSVNLNLTNASLSEDSTLFRLILSTDPSYLTTPNSACNSISDTSLLIVNKYPILVTSDTIVCSTPIDLTLPTYTKGSTFPANTVLSYYTTLANATAGTNALTTANAKAITNTAPTGTTYFIRAATTTSPTCAVVEPITVTINPLRTLQLAPQMPVCKDSAVFTSTATIQNISGISWRKSTSAVALQTGTSTSLLVTPTITDLANDSIWIIASSTDNAAILGACPNVRDSIKVKFFDPPTIEAPADTAFCLDKALVLLPLKASMNAANEIVWSTSASVKPTPLTGLATSLAITGAIDEKIYITARTKGCRPVTDSVQVKTEVIDTIDVTGPVKVCRNNPLVDAILTTSSTAGILWQTNGGGISPNSSSNSITYTPTAAEITSASVMLKAVTLLKPGQLCPTVADSITVGVFVEPSLQLPTDTTLCFLQNPTVLGLSSVLANADSLIWRTDNAIIPNPKNGVSTSLSIPSTSSFKVFGTAYKLGCIPIVDSLIVSLETPPKASATATFTCLPNLQVDLVGAVSITNTGIWSSSGNGNFGSTTTMLTPNSYIPSKQDSTKGDVTLTLTTVGQQYCPADDTTFLWKIIPLPKASAGNDTLVCIGSIIIRKTISNPDWTYEWRTSAVGSIVGTNPSFTFQASQDSSTFLTVRNSRACVATDNSVVNIEQKPKVSATATFTCLPNLQVNLVGTSSVTGSGVWSSSGNGFFGSAATDLSPNSYIPSTQDSTKGDVTLKLTSTGQVVCAAKDTSFLWTIIPLPKASAGDDTLVCINSNINRTTISNPDWKYEWRKTASGAIISSINTFSFLADIDTTRLFLTVANSRNCVAKDSAVVATITPPTISLPTQICLYAPRTMAATITNPPASGTYEWFKNELPTGVSANSLLLDTIAKYSYRFSFKGCSSSASIFTRAIPELIVRDTSACQNANTTFIANVIPQANYFWGPSKITNGTNKFDINAGNGISNFEVLVIDQNGCRDSVFSNITIVPYPTFTLAGSDLCPDETKSITTTLNTPSIATAYTISYTWTKDGVPISAPQWETLTYNQAGNYGLTLGVKGCLASNSFQINYHPNPKINIPLVYKHCFETDPPLALVSNPFKNYVWRSETGIIDTTQSVPVAPERDSYYFLAVKNNFGCKDSTKVLVRKVCPPRLFVPNVITPESQDVNADLKIFGANYTNFEITVFSRWGEVIFNSKDPNHTWNGEYLNDKMPIGNYQWLVTYEGDTEEYKGPYKKTGDVAIVR